MRSLPWAALGLAAAFGLCERSARADDCEPRLASSAAGQGPSGQGSSGQGFSTCVDVDNLWARPGNALFFATGTTSSTPAGEVAFGATVGYLRRPYRLEMPRPGARAARDLRDRQRAGRDLPVGPGCHRPPRADPGRPGDVLPGRRRLQRGRRHRRGADAQRGARSPARRRADDRESRSPRRRRRPGTHRTLRAGHAAGRRRCVRRRAHRDLRPRRSPPAIGWARSWPRPRSARASAARPSSAWIAGARSSPRRSAPTSSCGNRRCCRSAPRPSRCRCSVEQGEDSETLVPAEWLRVARAPLRSWPAICSSRLAAAAPCRSPATRRPRRSCA